SARGTVHARGWSWGDLASLSNLPVGGEYLLFTGKTVEDGKTIYQTPAACSINPPLNTVSREEMALLNRLNRGGSDGCISGTLQRPSDDFLTRIPFSNVTVTLKAGRRVYKTTTSATGAFLFEGLPGGTYRIDASGGPVTNGLTVAIEDNVETTSAWD